MVRLDPLRKPPSLEELLRPLRDRFRFLESFFATQEAATAARSPTALSTHGLAGLTDICRSGADLLDDLVEHLPRAVINAPVEGIRPLALRPRPAPVVAPDEPG